MLKVSNKTKVFSLFILVGALSVLFTSAAHASHFRFAHLTWQPQPDISATTVQFTLTASFRRSGYAGSGTDGDPIVGDVITENIGGTNLFFGDSQTTPTLRFEVVAFSVDENWINTVALDPVTGQRGILHTYSSATDNGLPWNAAIRSCCRTSGEENNSGGQYRVETLVELASGNTSPVSSLVPIVGCPIDSVCSFTVPGVDASTDSVLRWRLSSSSEAGPGFTQPVAPGGNAALPGTGITISDTEPNDDASASQSIVIGDDFQGSIDVGTDEDTVGFFALAGTTILATTVVGVDTILTLFDQDSNQLAFNNNGGAGRGSRIQFNVITDGTYFLQVRSFGTRTGSYMLQLREAAGSSGGPLTIDPETGIVSWPTGGTALGQLWSTQITIEERDVTTDALKTKVAIDFLIRITGGGMPPVCAIAPSDSYEIEIGMPLSFTVIGSTPISTETVILNTGGLPDGAIMSPSLPVDSGFDQSLDSAFAWTPTIFDVGVHAVTYSVMDTQSQQSLCSANITVLPFDPLGGLRRSPRRDLLFTLRRPTPDVISARCVETLDPANPDFGGLPFVPFVSDEVDMELLLSDGFGDKQVCCEFADLNGNLSAPFCGAVNFFELVEADDLSTRAKPGKVDLLWSFSGDAEFYEVFRSNTSGGPYTLIGTAAIGLYVDDNAPGGETFYYVVRAAVGVERSSDSNETIVSVPSESARRRR